MDESVLTLTAAVSAQNADQTNSVIENNFFLS